MAMSRSFGCRSFTTRPPIEISPALIGSSPAIMRNRVDLPQPEGPSRTTKLPSSILRSMPWITSRSPKLFLMLRTVTAAIALALPCTAGTRRQDPVGNLDESRAAARLGYEGWQRAHARCEVPHVCDAASVRKEPEHGLVVRAVAAEHEQRSHGLEVQPERIAHEHPCHRQLVVLPEPAVDVNRGYLGHRARLVEQRDDAVDRFRRQRLDIFPEVDGEIGLAIELVGCDRGARHFLEDALCQDLQLAAIARALRRAG